MERKSVADSLENYQVKLRSMDEILHQISCMDQAEDEKDLAQIISSLLHAIGRYTGADRVYIFDWVGENREYLGNTYEWCAQGVKPEIDNLKAVPVEMMPGWMEKFAKRETIVIEDLEQTRTSTPQEYEFLKVQEIHSLIAVPIYANHRMNGFIGVDNPELGENEISINLLADVGGHLGCVRENLKNTKMLKEALAKVTRGAEIISSLATLYTTIFYGNIRRRTYELLDGEPLMYGVVGHTGYFDEVAEEILATFVCNDMRGAVREFLNVDTLADRLQNTNSIMIEFKGRDENWRQAHFIVKSRDEDKRAVEVLYVARDITEEKRQELEYQSRLKKSALDAEKANQSKTAFLRRMSHDIRTPLNGIIGMIHIAEKYNTDVEKLKECRRKVLHSTDYLMELINNILDISKLESGSLVLEAKPFDLEELLEKQMTVIEANACEHEVAFVGGMEKTVIAHRRLIGSPLYLNRILMNLASNAIKYNRAHGTVRLQCRELPGTQDTAVYEFVCADTGLGMSEEFQKHAFEPFTQEGRETLTSFSGSGLGLSIVKDIVELMGGTIELESRENEGTTFTVTLPFQIDASAQDEQDKDVSSALQLTGFRALLVEDNELNLEIAQSILEEEGLSVETARNGKEALEAFERSGQGYFNLIFMDVIMPVMNGLEATKRLRSLNRPDAETIPVIAMTANAFEEDRKASLAAGMNEHVGKPIDQRELRRAIKRVLK